jgi:hypothetical protein
MTEAKIQYRGHCQCCGREQAVRKGLMSKHGYEVMNRGSFGWFNGVCGGNSHAPVEVDRTVLDLTVKMIRQECRAMVALAAEYKAGTKHPETITKSFLREKTVISWEKASEYDRAEALESATYRLESHAEMGFKQAAAMVTIADIYHGKPLQEVKKDAGPAPILIGEVRKLANGEELVVIDVIGAKVKFQTVIGGYIGRRTTRGWRILELVTKK